MAGLESIANFRFVGAFGYHELVIDGRRVPFVEATPIPGGAHLCLDHRLRAELSHDEAERVTPFLVDSIAVALGYACIQGHEVPNPPRPSRWSRSTEIALPWKSNESN